MTTAFETLLSAGDPAPVELVNEDSEHPVLLVCEHAGQAVPARLQGLGVSAAALDAHIGWDIGARAVTLLMARKLGAPAVLQRYSRLVIDCNRPPEASDAIPEVSDGVTVPANRALAPAERAARVTEIFDPFQQATSALLSRPGRRAAFAIHSFTPVLAGRARPWDIGFLFRHDSATSRALQAAIGALRPDLTIGINEPYRIDDESDWFVPRHGESSGLAHSLIEIRNDQIGTPAGQGAFADLLCSAITDFLRKS